MSKSTKPPMSKAAREALAKQRRAQFSHCYLCRLVRKLTGR